MRLEQSLPHSRPGNRNTDADDTSPSDTSSHSATADIGSAPDQADLQVQKTVVGYAVTISLAGAEHPLDPSSAVAVSYSLACSGPEFGGDVDSSVHWVAVQLKGAPDCLTNTPLPMQTCQSQCF